MIKKFPNVSFFTLIQYLCFQSEIELHLEERQEVLGL